MKKITLSCLAISLLWLQLPQSAWGQFDLGNAFRNEIHRGAQQIQGELRGAVRGAVREWRQGGPNYQTLPYPPPQHSHPIASPPGHGFHPGVVPPGFNPQPNPIVNPQPVIRPQPWPPQSTISVNPPSCATTPQAFPMITSTTQSTAPSQTRHQSQPQTQQQRQPQTETRTENLPTVFGGQEVVIDGEGFGDQAGSVRIKIGSMILMAKTTTWSDTTVEAVIPEMPLLEPTEALIAVISSEKEVIQQFAIQLTPAPEETASSQQADGSQLPTVQMGTELELTGDKLGSEPGEANLIIGDSQLAASVIKWSDDEVTIRIPDLPLAESMQGTIQLTLADGNPVSEIPVMFTK